MTDNSPSGIRVGARVRVQHNPDRDREYGDAGAQVRRRLNRYAGEVKSHGAEQNWFVEVPGVGSAWFEREELAAIVTDPDAAPCRSPIRSSFVCDITTAAAALEARWLAAEDAATADDRRAQEALASLAAVRDELASARADAGALRAALEAATGAPAGLAVPELVKLLAAKLDAEEAVRATLRDRAVVEWRAELAAEREARQALKGQIAGVASAFDAVRALLMPGRTAPLAMVDVRFAVAAVDQALAGSVAVPSPEPSGALARARHRLATFGPDAGTVGLLIEAVAEIEGRVAKVEAR